MLNNTRVPRILLLPDMIAVPDFDAGAMENWGLIIYRETALLFESGVSSETNRERVAIVVSHELAHQVIFRSNEIYFVMERGK